MTNEGGLVAVVGNPRPLSRTLRAASALASMIGGDLDKVKTIDLAGHHRDLLGDDEDCLASLKRTVTGADLLIVASPTYKGSFTGLLKLFLDEFDQDELDGTFTVPFMTGGNSMHALAVEVHLRPVLIEIGASCPTRGVFLVDAQLDEPDGALREWYSTQSSHLGWAKSTQSPPVVKRRRE